jgi:hypothetical protein
MDPDTEPDQTGNGPDVTVGHHRRPWMPTWVTDWLTRIRAWPWMPTALIALVVALLYFLFRRGQRS